MHVLWFKRNWAEASHVALGNTKAPVKTTSLSATRVTTLWFKNLLTCFLQYIHMNFVTDLNWDLSMYVGVAKLIVI